MAEAPKITGVKAKMINQNPQNVQEMGVSAKIFNSNIVTETHLSVNNTPTQRTYSKNNSENSFSKQLASIAAVGGVR
jgi:hypothetical protein